MIYKNALTIDSLIERENSLINQYESYLKTVENTPMYDSVKELIQKHNSHISTLQKLVRR
jgi:rubrerythrin